VRAAVLRRASGILPAVAGDAAARRASPPRTSRAPRCYRGFRRPRPSPVADGLRGPDGMGPDARVGPGPATPPPHVRARRNRVRGVWAAATRLRACLGGYRLLNGPRWALVY